MSDLLLRAAAAEDRAVSAEREMQRLRRALVEIRDHWACQYDHPRKQTPMYAGSYGIGVTDGHRAAAEIARKALAPFSRQKDGDSNEGDLTGTI